ncbi:MFS transporter [Candidatus Gracilibacteria bacterium]|nr:MFS transporter [Candidatus Gracilibacteria bacterium]
MKLLHKFGDPRLSVAFLLTFVNGLSMTMLFPVLPFVIKLYDQPEVVLGILFATFSLFQFIAAPILGGLSDKYGRKPILILTQAGTFLSWVVLGIAATLPEKTLFGFLLLPILVIFLSRMFDGITGGNASVAQAMMADITKSEERSKVFGINGAVFGFSIMIGPALGSLAMTGNQSYLGVAILGGSISAIALGIMFFILKETLPPSKSSKEIKISLKKLNVFSQIQTWGKIPMIRSVIITKLFMYSAFVAYTSISTLYLIDFFGFSADKVGYYLTFTGSFIIFHQSVSIRYFLGRFGDRWSLTFALFCLGIGFIVMGFSQNIIFFTLFYFVMVLGVALAFTTMGSLLSRSVDASHQGEVMGMSTSLESFISIGIPILATYVYGLLDFSIYFIIAILPFIAFLISYFFSPNIDLPARKKHA